MLCMAFWSTLPSVDVACADKAAAKLATRPNDATRLFRVIPTPLDRSRAPPLRGALTFHDRTCRALTVIGSSSPNRPRAMGCAPRAHLPGRHARHGARARRIRAGDDGVRAFAIDGLREHGGRGGAIARDGRPVAGHLAHHLRAQVFDRISQIDLVGDGDAVLGDRRRSERLVEDDVAAPGAKGHLDRIGQLIDAPENRRPRLLAVGNLLGHAVRLSLCSWLPRFTSSSFEEVRPALWWQPASS